MVLFYYVNFHIILSKEILYTYITFRHTCMYTVFVIFCRNTLFQRFHLHRCSSHKIESCLNKPNGLVGLLFTFFVCKILWINLHRTFYKLSPSEDCYKLASGRSWAVPLVYSCWSNEPEIGLFPPSQKDFCFLELLKGLLASQKGLSDLENKNNVNLSWCKL